MTVTGDMGTRQIEGYWWQTSSTYYTICDK